MSKVYTMDIDEMWNAFQESRSIKKTSIAEKLDTLAAQNNEIQTSLSRVAEIVPKILGDDAAIETSNAQVPPMDPSMMGGMGGAPPMGDPTGGAVPGAEEMSPDGMEPTGEDMTDDTLMPPTDGMPPEGAPMDAGPVPEDPTGGMGAPTDIEGGVPEDIPVDDGLGAGAPMDGDVPPVDEPLPDAPPMDGAMGGSNGTIDALMNMLHEKVDEGNMADVKALADAIEQIGGGGGMDVAFGADLAESPAPTAPQDLGAPSMEAGPAPEMGAPEEDAPAPSSEPSSEEGSSDGGSDSSDSKSDDSSDKKDDSDKTAKSALGSDSPAVADMGPIAASSDDSNESEMEKVMDVLSNAQAEVAEIMNGGSPEEAEPTGEVEVEIEAEPESDDSPEAELSEEGESPIKEGVGDECGADVAMKSVKKSLDELSFKDFMDARSKGESVLSDYIQKSAGETNGYNESDPWLATRRTEMFMKSETIADEVSSPESQISGKHDNTDSTTVADDIKEPMDHTKGHANGGDMIDDVDEEKGTSDHSVGDGDLLEDVDEKKGTSDHSVDDGDLLDDVDEDKGTSDHETDGGDLLDDVDKKVRKTAADTGIEVKSIKDMLAIKKTGGFDSSRPDTVATVNGDLTRPELGKLQKSLSPKPVRMGYGVDPRKVVEADWAEYNLYKAQSRL